MSWLKKVVKTIRLNESSKEDNNIPEGLWYKCVACEATLYRVELDKNQCVCPKCGEHIAILARKRIEHFLDNEDGYRLDEILPKAFSVDVLNFKDKKAYPSRLNEAHYVSNELDAFVAAKGKLKGRNVVVGAFEFTFMGGSMGSVVGEKFVTAAEIALEKKSPMICFSASGGARMQESLFSLMQMARTSAAIGRLKKDCIPFISVLTNPTFGGVTASLAMLGDINIAEPKALIGFAGPRVIEQTVKQTLPKGFQRSEFLQEHGTIDMICSRLEMRDKIDSILSILTKKSYA